MSVRSGDGWVMATGSGGVEVCSRMSPNPCRSSRSPSVAPWTRMREVLPQTHRRLGGGTDAVLIHAPPPQRSTMRGENEEKAGLASTADAIHRSAVQRAADVVCVGAGSTSQTHKQRLGCSNLRPATHRAALHPSSANRPTFASPPTRPIRHHDTALICSV